MLRGNPNTWGLLITSVADGVQPGLTYGTSVTPGASNTYGSYTSILSGASVTDDCYLMEVIVSSAASTGIDRGMLVTIGFDPAGGTSFGGLGGVTGNEINDLLCSGAAAWYAAGVPGGGYRFMFPLVIKSGTAIGAKAQTNDSTAGTVRVAVNLWGRPSRPELVRAGSFVRSFGANLSTTDGVAVTQGTASEGSWTEIGTAADSLWGLVASAGARSATLANHISHSDISIGDASNKRVVMRDLYMKSTASEATMRWGDWFQHVNIVSGDKIYGRSQATAAQGTFSMCAYGIGG